MRRYDPIEMTISSFMASPLESKDILMTSQAVPEAAHPLISELDRYSMRKEGGNNADRHN